MDGLQTRQGERTGVLKFIHLDLSLFTDEDGSWSKCNLVISSNGIHNVHFSLLLWTSNTVFNAEPMINCKGLGNIVSVAPHKLTSLYFCNIPTPEAFVSKNRDQGIKPWTLSSKAISFYF